MPNIGSGTGDSNSYGLPVAFIYIFNLIVGTGSLTMPKAFENSGYILSSFLLVFLNLMSFVTATFMFESMSITNAIRKYQKIEEDEENKKKLGYANPIAEIDNNDQNLNTSSTDVQNNSQLNYSDDIINEDRPLIEATTSTSIETNNTNRRLILINNLDQDENDNNNDNYSNQNTESGHPSDFTESSRFGIKSLQKRQSDKLFLIRNKYEMGEMAGMFFSKLGQFFFYIAMIFYLYGDLAIYDAAVPKSFRDTTW
jgi:hypothetical protein